MIIWNLILVVVKAGLSFFMPSKDEKLGKLEVENADKTAVIKDDQTAHAAADVVDRADDAAADVLRSKLNDRP